MPLPAENYYNFKKLRVIFACSSLALLASIVWMIKVDYNRPWRRIQNDFTDLQACLAYFDVLETQTRQSEQELSAAAKAVEEARAQAEKTYEDLSNQRRRRLINLPLFDFASPKGTAGRNQIRQVILPDIRVEWNFVQGDATDRCMTCHVAINDKSFAKEQLAKRLERAILTINELASRDGEPLLTLPVVKGRDDLEPGRIAEVFNSLTHQQQKAYLNALVEQINVYQSGHGKQTLQLGQPLLAHPNLDLFVSEDSPHPMSKMGCTVCHQGNGEETDFVLAAHTAPSPATRQEWKEKYYVKTAGLVPEHDFETAQRHWDRPMLPKKNLEAGCTKCHSKAADIAVYDGKPQATKINQGRLIFTSLGCVNCHLVKELADSRQVGPDLSHVGQKLDRGFMHNWIWSPKDYVPSTKMPHFFQQENNDAWSETAGGDDDPILRTRTEVAAITEYLFTVSENYDYEHPPAELWEPLKDEQGDQAARAARRGRKLFGSVGCLGCHAALAYQPEDKDNLAKGESLGSIWIVRDLAVKLQAAKLKNGEQKLAEPSDEQLNALWDRAFEQYEQMTYIERIEYALRNFNKQSTTLFNPENVDGPVFTRFAPELSSIRTKFTDYEHAVKWLYDWLKNPRHYSGYTKMPRMQLVRNRLPASDSETGGANNSMVDADEALDIAVYLSTLSENTTFSKTLFDADERECKLLVSKFFNLPDKAMIVDKIEAMSPDRRRWMDLGFQLIGHYGCCACHRIGGFEKPTRPGPEMTDWGEKALSQLDFAWFDPEFASKRARDSLFRNLYPHNRDQLIRWAGANRPEQIEHTRASFAGYKVRNPRIWDRGILKKPYDKLKMPNFFLDDNQADAVVTFVLSRKPSRVNDPLLIDYQDTPEGKIADGRNLARQLNCYTCHLMDGNAATIHQYYLAYDGEEMTVDEELIPPRLHGLGARVESAWLYDYLNNVQPIRPWLKARMPTFYLDDKQATQLVEYFAGLSQQEARWLDRKLAPVRNYVDKHPLGRDWFRQDELTDVADSLRRFAVLNRLIPAYSVDPQETTPAEFIKTHQEIIKQAGFFGELLNITYPFTESPPGSLSPDELADAQTMFWELKCLSCHVFGDPSADGANVKPSAPNLQYIHKRLRSGWVPKYLEGPARLQPGTKMPNIFGEDRSSAFANYPAKARERVLKLLKNKDLIDDGPRQIALITSWLYNAGEKRLNIVQPPASTDTEDSEGADEAK